MMLLIIILVIVVGILIFLYSGLIASKNNVDNVWNQIDVQIQRRFDLIPNLVEAVKGYMKHEETVLNKVVELRSLWVNAKNDSEKIELDNQLSETLKTIKAVSENYPELKANQNFSELQEELRNTEDKITYSRQIYNDNVKMYNTKLQTFPTNIIANVFGFQEKELFKVDSDDKK